MGATSAYCFSIGCGAATPRSAHVTAPVNIGGCGFDSGFAFLSRVGDWSHWRTCGSGIQSDEAGPTDEAPHAPRSRTVADHSGHGQIRSSSLPNSVSFMSPPN